MPDPQSVGFQEDLANYEDDPLDRPSFVGTKTNFRLNTQDIIDQSRSHDAEKVLEVSPNERYVRLNTLLGKGAYKIVYKAIDREEGYEVAWNTMQATKSIDHKEMEHEIGILKSVRHPNIIAFHDAWHHKNEFVFITELMTSGTLREYIRKLNLPNLKIVKRWSRQILKGLAYLHGYNPPIIHRDIKCDNIFINGAHGEVKIGDMGTAEMKMGKKYTIIGTPEFMAPEMYEEQGYNEKVDIYAFGMCLLEMVTGDYPYGECKNAAQIYKKVSSGVKPASLSEIQNDEVKHIIENCLNNEEERMSAQEILEHTFLAVEPDVVLLAADPAHVHLTLQVIFKGMDKLSVKFDFNVETDTAEQVVREMIEEQVLPERYQHHITKEINRILRDMEKPAIVSSEDKEEKGDGDDEDQTKDSIWRRESDIRTELEKTREQLEKAAEHVIEVESKCDGYENRAIAAELRYQNAIQSILEMKETQLITSEQLEILKKKNPRFDHDLRIDTTLMARPSAENEPKKPESSASPPLTSTTREALVSRILEEYADDTDIELFVRDCAIASHRNVEKAHEWANKLKNQDIMTVGDLRDLHDEDWAGIGLTVFALRALKNMLKGKKHTINGNGNTPATSGPNSARVSPPP
ncbi:Serine/threonine-protein kinase pkpA [Choanephora cucurbitarum]|uniref:Serine/threonine-protein kinase pkpA n=1 Tax=Choanephora cucurbitarum TaxID=101091 RepID=A0A1C7NJY3_9FUNG|nr:Serine/threonine-protein kinase pkpA [Choanephora cucurbitarum]